MREFVELPWKQQKEMAIIAWKTAFDSNESRGGCMCTFAKIGKTKWAVKAYNWQAKKTASHCFALQSLAHNVKAGPAVLGKVFSFHHQGIWWAYLTQIADTVYERYTKRTIQRWKDTRSFCSAELHSVIPEVERIYNRLSPVMSVRDLHGNNIGWVGDEIVAIDFDLCVAR